MVGEMNLGDRFFKTQSQGLSLPPSQNDRQYFNFEANFNSITGVVNAFAVNFFQPFSFPFAVYLEHIQIFGDYHGNSQLAKTQPQIASVLYAQGATFPTLGTVPPSFTTGFSVTIGQFVTVTGILNSPIEYKPPIPVFIPPQTLLAFDSNVNFFAATLADDVLQLTARFVFSN